MFKKVLASLFVLLMLTPIFVGVAAAELPVKSTVEDILGNYHQKLFEKQIQEDDSVASMCFYGDGDEDTLEQETINDLVDAGYEAYHVTADNYEILETNLQTDFAAMGLDPDGSYIIVISGEDTDISDMGSGNSTFGFNPLPGEEEAPEGGESSFFTYTYNNKTYNMRYVTVTPTDNSGLRRIDHAVLNDELDPSNLLEIIGMSSSVVGYLDGALTDSTVVLNNFVSISLLLMDALPNYTPKLTDMVRMTGGCLWTVKYTQIYDFSEDTWFLNAGVEYVTVQKYVDYDIYNPSTYLYDSTRVTYDNEVIYSSLYNNAEIMKQMAVAAYEYGQGDNRYLDQVERVDFKYGNDKRTVLTIWRTSADFVD